MSKTSRTVVGDMLPRGNAFLAGCDGFVPGFCLHDELEALTEAGLSPLQAIQTATINPAKFLGREKTQGTIEAGKRADLVLLDAEPAHGHTQHTPDCGGHRARPASVEDRD